MSVLDPKGISAGEGDQRYIKASETVVPSIGPASQYKKVIVDNNKRVLFGIKDDNYGTVEAGFLEVGVEANLKRINGVNVSYLSQDVTGYVYALTDKSNNIIFGIKTNGNVTIPLLEQVSNGASSTNGIAEKYRLTGSSDSGLDIISNKNITLAGHSMLAGAAGAITSALSSVSITNLSVGGETSRLISGRQGGQPILFSLANGSLPAAVQAVPITLSFETKETFTNWPLLQGASSYTGYLQYGSVRIPGTFGIQRDPAATQYIHHANDVYTFTRTTAGSSDSTLNRPTPFYYTIADAHRADTFVYWAGRNNITQPSQVIADIQAMVQWQTGLDKRFLVLSDHNSSSEPTGSGNYTNAMTINSTLRNLYGRRFIDTRRYLIDYGLSDASITPTTQDTTDIANDVVPSSLRADAIHLNTAGSTIVANLIKQRLQEFGWYV